ncbi:hypothetical protein EV189_1902 [Motilibacter rhizosphaerae]|uniref:Uncharacterized protein n=1 Tax=Motilibacter rhizosphaerae TaxID=598652 RepID=A0A4V2F4Q3_9ACTN|nr:hypothetical protein [Motilibacter rhizosphaerae]RZS90119.1 hypothetical protein EV189_1902 [Motilibacter rhizosphaerae]
MRVYLPATAAVLAALREARVLGPAPLRAYAVTDDVRADVPGEDEEEAEFLATLAAARESVLLLAADGSAPRRVVIAADVSTARPDDDPARGAGAVLLGEEVPLARMASVHADEEAAEQAVAAAAADPTEERLDACEEHDLLWWATQELDELLADLGGAHPDGAGPE